MVRYFDPELGSELPRTVNRKSPVERLRQMREENQALDFDTALEKAREYSLKLLDSSARSSDELRNKLRQRGFDERVVECLIERFRAVNLLADSEYAAMLVRTRFAERGLVGKALQRELAKKGISGTAAATAIDQISPEQIEAKALALAERKMRSLANVERRKALNRTVSHLARKGYSAGLSWKAAQAAWENYQDDGDY